MFSPIILGWSNDDERILVENVKKMLSKNDRVKYNTHMKRLDWDKVKFDEYSATDCEHHFSTLLKSIRHYRILLEICEDMEVELAKMPFKRPMTGYNLFMKDLTKRKGHVRLFFFCSTVSL